MTAVGGIDQIFRATAQSLERFFARRKRIDYVLQLDDDTDADRNGAAPGQVNNAKLISKAWTCVLGLDPRHAAERHFQSRNPWSRNPSFLPREDQSFVNCHDNLFALGSLDGRLASCILPRFKSRERFIRHPDNWRSEHQALT